MPNSLKLVGFTSAALLTSLTLLAGCDDGTAADGGEGASPGTGATTGTGASTGTGAAGGTTGAGAAGGTTAAGAAGGTTGAGAAGGTTAAGGNGTGGNASGGNGTGGNATGGNGTGGSSGGAGGAGGDVDEMGKGNAKPGDTTNQPRDYLRLGEIRILNNNWGSAELQASSGCMPSESTMNVFVNQDKTFGWTFDRQNCDKNDSNQKPDFPQLEFGIHPFGIGSSLATSPSFSSTTLLPIKISDVQSMSVTLENLSIELQASSSWNITFEFWISKNDPRTADAGVHAELMTFWGWQPNRWPDSDPNHMPIIDTAGAAGTLNGGDKTYKLWVQDNEWADNKWKYFQFRDANGPSNSFTGKVDVKKLIDYLTSAPFNYSKDYWITRLEVGSEIDDNTKGTVKMSNVIFEVNNQTRSPVFGQ